MKIFVYPRKIEHWRRKTAHLSLEQRGIYSELIDWYYCTGGELPSDLNDLCRMIGATSRSERKNLMKIISDPELFSIDGRRLVQKMCDETLTFIAQKSVKASTSAKSKYNKNNDLPYANAERSVSERSANYKLQTINHNNPPPTPPYEMQSCLDVWNAMAKKYKLAQAEFLTTTRGFELRNRLAECGGLDGWCKAVERVGASSFLNDPSAQWKPTIDWFLKQENFTKVREGNYDNKKQKSASPYSKDSPQVCF